LIEKVIDIKVIPVESDCDAQNGYSEYEIMKWPGTIEGMYIQSKE
jgi:hypothetical protein